MSDIASPITPAPSLLKPQSVFARCFPITMTSFINRSGEIGISILPVILVDKQLSATDASWILGFVKIAGLAGILLSGLLSDRFGMRRVVLFSFVLCIVGLGPLPFVTSILAISALAACAQIGTSCYPVSVRLLLTSLIPVQHHREAIAWQRAANNLAQVLSYSLGTFLGRWGTGALLTFDALTSITALGVGSRILPAQSEPSQSEHPADRANPEYPEDSTSPKPHNRFTRKAPLGRFYGCALMISGFSMMYELFNVSAAARCRIHFGSEGLRVFSQMMIINTVLCAMLALVAAKKLSRPSVVLPAGLMMIGLGMLVTFGLPVALWTFMLGSLLVTLGEISFMALAAASLVAATPESQRSGLIYSSGVLVQYLGKILGAALAFPLIVHSEHPARVIFVTTAVAVALCIWVNREEEPSRYSLPIPYNDGPEPPQPA